MLKSKPGTGERFKKLTNELEKKGKSKKSAKAIAATIGHKKYGNKKMTAMAVKGKKK